MQGSTQRPTSCKRIAIVGCSGAGKSTLARHLAKAWGLNHLELDAIFHQPNWTPLPPTEFREALNEQAPENGEWIACGNYGSSGGDDMRARADCIIFLDLPRFTIMKRILRRTLGRLFTREVLWNGNRESLLGPFHPDPRKNIILYSILTWGGYRRRYGQFVSDGTWQHARVVHLTTPAMVQELMDQASRAMRIESSPQKS